MSSSDKPRRTRLFGLGFFFAFSIAILAAVVQSRLKAAGLLQPPGQSLVALKLKFDGAASCGNASCHGAAQPGATRAGNESTVWAGQDKHHTAFETLNTPASKAIATALKIASASGSSRCLSCHALEVPAAQQGANYNIKEGVTCNACHGPSEKWLGPHKTAGWLAAQRTASGNDPQKLLAATGIYDAKTSLVARADRCTSCHLAIDPAMVAAGHPLPKFEIAYFSDAENKHWTDPDGLFVTRLWAVGQAVCLRDAAAQLADRVTSGAGKADLAAALGQVTAHYMLVKDALAPMDAAGAANLMQQFKTMGPGPSAAAATGLSKTAADIAAKFDKAVWSKAQTTAALTSVSNENFTDDYANLQQAEGAYELYTALKLPDGPAATAFSDLLPADPGGTVDHDKYPDKLKAARKNLPK